ncbi:SGNH/GDSL hydrolase family protein [Actinoplanes teichomyceticus]|uniref:Lysophospholipase L1-like esterase n=1 Tax=Actinoplanes teichomyceticus TaxID=1867 RepID=A0A561WLE0_ACTTI|nr:SGNH/GDSL hydrolase family protein [Actinoplanes teichomyceticus]TWG24681.1 lysophospholipase L1-like esterase [Actinoplanes teichomyceticus]GIF14656.1 SGNH hydrolase [Actinoplanes teichomyceticus]
MGGAGAAALFAAPGVAGPRHPARSRPAWTGSWATATTAARAAEPVLPAGRTLRQVVHLSLGGSEPRIRLTNEYGQTPVRLSEIWTGLRAGGPDSTAMHPGSIRRVTFDGSAAVVLPAGATVVSDPVPDLPLPPGADLVITFHLPDPTRIGTISPFVWQRNRILAGNVAAEPDPPGGRATTRYTLLSGVSVRTPGRSAAVVAFGDSITCGSRTRIGANRRWPDLLARRLREAGQSLGVLNAGIGGNRLLSGPDLSAPVTTGGFGGGSPGNRGVPVTIGPAGLRRFDRDVLFQPGARYVITLIGVNDIAHTDPGAPALIAGHRELIARARAAGLAVFGGTLLPFGGSGRDNAPNRATRAALNEWIRDSGEYDAVIDFDAAVRDGANPERMYPAYDSGDHLHPNDLGMLALASAVPLALFA